MRNAMLAPLFVATFLLGGIVAPLGAADVTPPAKEPAKEEIRKDRFEDPLPTDAISRLGTIRWRQGTPITLLSFLPENKEVLTVGTDQIVRIWDAATGRMMRNFNASGLATPLDTGVAEWMYNPGQQWAVLSGDCKWLATASQRDMKVRVWEVATGKMSKEIAGLQNGLTSLTFSADAKYVSCCSYDGSVHLIDVNAGKIDKTWNKPDGQNRVWYGGMNGATFSPDNKMLVTIGNDMENQQYIPCLKIWDVANGKQIHSIRNPQGTYGFYTPTYAPDGKTLAWGSSDGTIRLYDPVTAKELRKLTPSGQRTGGMIQLVFSHDGKRLYTKSYGQQGFREFDVATGKEERQLGDVTYKQPRNVYYYSYSGGMMSVSKDNKKLIGVGGNNSIYMVDLTTGKEVPTTTAGHDSIVMGVQYVEGGKTLITQGMDGSMRRWEAATGKELEQVKMPAQIVNSYVNILSPDGKTVASASYDGTVQLAEAATGKLLHKVTIDNQQRGYVLRLVFSPDSKMIAARSQVDTQIHLISVATGKTTQKLVPMSQTTTTQNYYGGNQWQFLLFSPDSKYVAAGGTNQDTSIRVWETSNGNEMRQFPMARDRVVNNGAFSPDGRTLALEANDGMVTVYELQTGKQRRQFGESKIDPRNPYGNVYYNPYGVQTTTGTVSYSPNGQLLAVIGKDRKVHLWEIATGKELGVFEGHNGTITALSFAPDNKSLTTASSDTTALVWDVTRRDKNRTPRTAELKMEQLDVLYKALDASDAKQAADAFASLWAAPKSVVPFLAENIKPAVATEESKVIQLIADLDNNRFSVRKRALDELEKMGDMATPHLKRTLGGTPSVEVKKRITELMERVMARSLTADQLRGLRVVELLEQIATPEAKELLTKLAKGAPSAFLTTEAQAALDRMGK